VLKLQLASSFGWLTRDAWLIVFARGVRMFGKSYLAILLALYLDLLGFSLAQIGLFLSVGVAGSAFFAFIVGFVAGKFGRRRLLVTFALISASPGLALFFIDSFLPLLVIAFLGSFTAGGGAGGEGPAQPLELASLPDTAPDHRRTDLFAIYGIVARVGTALGALAAGLPALYGDALGMSTITSYKVMFVGFALFQVIGAVLYGMLSPAVEGGVTGSGWTNPFKLPSRRRIFTLTGLFGVDTFATSLLVQSLVAFWFATKFGLDLKSLPFIFFFSHLLAATSLGVSAKIANKIGLVNTVVFTQIPANVFLIAAAFSPVGWLAVMFWLLRSFLGQMDVPARDSYTMAVVGPEERVSMASVSYVGRSVMGSAGPSAASALWSGLSASAPFIGCAVLKSAYDISLFFMFRNIKPPEEIAADTRDTVAQRADSS